MTRENLSSSIARQSKAFIARRVPEGLTYRQGRHENILVFASRRSGSTYLARLLSCGRGVRYVDQPFELFYPQTDEGAIKCASLPPMPLSQFISLNEKESARVRSYTATLLNGGLRSLGRIDRWGVPFLATRTVLKITNALPLLDWFNDHCDALAVYLVRHPIPQALSVVRNEWGITAEAFLENDAFCRAYLNEDQTRLGRQILAAGSYFQQAVLNWCLENLVPLQRRRSNATVVTYEELVLFPEETIAWLAEALSLSNVKGMLSMVREPQQAKLSEKRTRTAIRQGKRERLISRWGEVVTGEEREDAREILEAFGIFEYRVDDVLPTGKLLRFGGMAEALG
jgi:hypothetical protein